MKTVVDAQRAGTIFKIETDDERLVIVNDEASPLYDERLKLPVSEQMALSLAREGQLQPGKVRKNGPTLEVLDGRQRLRAMRLANEWVDAGDPRVAFRGGQRLVFMFEVVKTEDDRDAIRKMIAANLRIDEPPMIRARRIARAIKWGLTPEEVQINYGFKTKKTVEKILKLLDCCKEVQESAESGEMTQTLALLFVDLDHKKQRELHQEMRAKGLMRGASAVRAVKEKLQGKAVTGATVGKRMLKREFVENYLDEIRELKGNTPAAVRAHLHLLLGDKAVMSAAALDPFRDAIQRAQRR
jgi:ParB family chromosome partitioning protein